MVRFIVKIFDYLKSHPWVRHTSFVLLTLALFLGIFSLNHKEDISDFLPLGSRYTKAMGLFQQISGTDRIIITFSSSPGKEKEPEELTEALESFYQKLQDKADADSSNTLVHSALDALTLGVDYDRIFDAAGFVYSNIPYFLTDEDYQRIESSLANEDGRIAEEVVAERLKDDKRMLLFPVGGLLSQNIGRDPLNIFTPTVEKLQSSASGLKYELSDGYIFSPDMSRAIATLTSPFGASETKNNARLAALLEEVASAVESESDGVEIHVTGGPVIAVGNASQIKKDSLLSVAVAIVLILTLLFVCFRSRRNLLLIALSIGWGWLFAMGGLALFHNTISVIIVGISSVILGIAVNYPLHLVAHLNYVPTVRQALKEVAGPLVVGNVTTVGAFLALVPLKSAALSDLGLFAALLLLGTIIFVLLYLPHVVKGGVDYSKRNIFSSFGEVNLESKRWIIVCVLVLTVVFAYFARRTSFDANISHINYMNAEQKSDMAFFQDQMLNPSSLQTIYMVNEASTSDAALEKASASASALQALKDKGVAQEIKSCLAFLPSKAEQQRRLERWNGFVEKYGDQLAASLRKYGKIEGFAENSFSDFLDVLNDSYSVQEFEYFSPLHSVFASNVLQNESKYYVVDQLLVKDENLAEASRLLGEGTDDSFAFDMVSMNSAIASSLADDFDYIGWACSLIVFFFLWFSLGSLEMALISFIPMAVSWIWILGIMGFAGVQFNVVNIILATFIFGQGDDYTVFMTEGCQYEYAYRRKMISSYKNGITISALIMFIGIGSLILARHPALHSLAQVTIIGMFSVVLMAYLLPPLVFKWLVSCRGEYRVRPLSFNWLFNRAIYGKKYGSAGAAGVAGTSASGALNADPRFFVSLVKDRYRYKGVEVFRTVKRRLRKFDNYSEWILDKEVGENLAEKVVVIGNGLGEFSLLLALNYPGKQIVAYEAEELNVLLARHAAEGIAPNLVVERAAAPASADDRIAEESAVADGAATVVLIEPTPELEKRYASHNPIVVR